MRKTGFLASAACAAVLAAAPAAADYVIEEDPAFPSVIYINFDASTMPLVLLAPQPGEFGRDGGQSPGAGTDYTSPDLINADKAADDASDDAPEEEETVPDDVSASANQRIEDRVQELSVNSSAVEDVIIKNEIDTRVLENVDLLR